MIDLSPLAYEDWIEHNGQVIDAQEGIKILQARIARVEALHRQHEYFQGFCAHCVHPEDAHWSVEYPCPTVRALTEGEPSE